MEKIKPRSLSQDNSTSIVKVKHPSLESQRRRPSSIAEQAMRTLVISGHPRTEHPLSQRQSSLVSERSTDILNSPLPSMMTLRETNIRNEGSGQQQQPNNRTFNSVMNSGVSSLNFLARERDNNAIYNRISNSIRDSAMFSAKEMNSRILSMPHRGAPTTRLPSTGIDQRIMKQSSEDCRRLLQQVSLS